METVTVEESVRRIDAGDDGVHAFVCRSEGLQQDLARLRDRSKDLPLYGVPLAVKDIIDVAGLPTRCGSSITSPEPVLESAACVRRLEDLGAVVVGKTVTTEYAYFAPGPTNNPKAPGHTPGGSSSGSAAAVAAGMVPLALGSQTAGSVTRPAAYCGVAGMVLAQGSTDLSGVTGLSRSLDSLGFLAPTVDDLARVWSAFTGVPGLGQGDRVLIWQGSELDRIDPAMVGVLDRAAAVLAEAGLAIAELVWGDHIQCLAADHGVIMAFEACRERSDALARIDELSPQFADLLTSGTRVTEDDYRHACYRRDRSRLDLFEHLAPEGVILAPAALGPAPAGLGATGSPILSRPWQALGLPVVCVPGARSAAGLPLGVQLIGQPGSEGALFRVGGLLQQRLTGFRSEERS